MNKSFTKEDLEKLIQLVEANKIPFVPGWLPTLNMINKGIFTNIYKKDDDNEV